MNGDRAKVFAALSEEEEAEVIDQYWVSHYKTKCPYKSDKKVRPLRPKGLQHSTTKNEQSEEEEATKQSNAKNYIVTEDINIDTWPKFLRKGTYTPASPKVDQNKVSIPEQSEAIDEYQQQEVLRDIAESILKSSRQTTREMIYSRIAHKSNKISPVTNENDNAEVSTDPITTTDLGILTNEEKIKMQEEQDIISSIQKVLGSPRSSLSTRKPNSSNNVEPSSQSGIHANKKNLNAKIIKQQVIKNSIDNKVPSSTLSPGTNNKNVLTYFEDKLIVNNQDAPHKHSTNIKLSNTTERISKIYGVEEPKRVFKVPSPLRKDMIQSNDSNNNNNTHTNTNNIINNISVLEGEVSNNERIVQNQRIFLAHSPLINKKQLSSRPHSANSPSTQSVNKKFQNLMDSFASLSNQNNKSSHMKQRLFKGNTLIESSPVQHNFLQPFSPILLPTNIGQTPVSRKKSPTNSASIINNSKQSKLNPRTNKNGVGQDRPSSGHRASDSPTRQSMHYTTPTVCSTNHATTSLLADEPRYEDLSKPALSVNTSNFENDRHSGDDNNHNNVKDSPSMQKLLSLSGIFSPVSPIMTDQLPSKSSPTHDHDNNNGNNHNHPLIGNKVTFNQENASTLDDEENNVSPTKDKIKIARPFLEAGIAANFLESLKNKKKSLKKTVNMSTDSPMRNPVLTIADKEQMQKERAELWQQLQNQVNLYELERASASIEYGKLLGRGKFAAVFEGRMLVASSGASREKSHLLSMDRKSYLNFAISDSSDDENKNGNDDSTDKDKCHGNIQGKGLHANAHINKEEGGGGGGGHASDHKSETQSGTKIARQISWGKSAEDGSHPLALARKFTESSRSLFSPNNSRPVAVKQAQYRDSSADISSFSPLNLNGSFGRNGSMDQDDPTANLPPIACSKEFLREIIALTELSSPCIVGLIGVILRPKLALILELMEGNLSTRLDEAKWQVGFVILWLWLCYPHSCLVGECVTLSTHEVVVGHMCWRVLHA